MQEFATTLYREVFDTAIGITPGVLKNVTNILRPDRVERPQELLALIDAARWEGKTLWEAFGEAGMWKGRAEQLAELLRASSVGTKIAWLRAAGGIQYSLGVLSRIEAERVKYHRTGLARRWIITSLDCVTCDSRDA